MTSNNAKARKRLNALDIFIILAVAACIGAVGIRAYMGENGGVIGKTSPETGEYLLSFLILDVREDTADCYTPDNKFVVEKGGEPFGYLVDMPSFTPAEVYVENDVGEYILTYSKAEGDDARIDIRGTFRVSGSMTEEGFLLNGKTYLAPNKILGIQSIKNFVNIIITDITKAS